MISFVPQPTNITTPYYGSIPNCACSEIREMISSIKIGDFSLIPEEPVVPTKVNPAASQNYMGQACAVPCALSSSDSINYQP